MRTGDDPHVATTRQGIHSNYIKGFIVKSGQDV